MKHVKWILVLLSITILFSFVDKGKVGSGYGVGDKLPEFTLKRTDGEGEFTLNELKGNYVLLSLWASHNAASRANNVQLYRTLGQLSEEVKMVSVSFDEYRSVFVETIKFDGIDSSVAFMEVEGKNSPLYRKHRLERGFRNYLLDKDGVIIAKNVSAEKLNLLF